jgi:hypothetical protein
MQTLSPPETKPTEAKECVICVPTDFGTVHKSTTFAEAWKIKSVIVGVKEVLVPSTNSEEVIFRDAIAAVVWSNLPHEREYKLKARLRSQSYRAYGFNVGAEHVVRCQGSIAETRLEEALKRFRRKGEPFTADDVIDSAAMLETTVLELYPEFYESLIVAANQSRGGLNRAVR